MDDAEKIECAECKGVEPCARCDKIAEALLDVLPECEGCDGSGIRDYAEPSCCITIPEGTRIVERCDSCERFSSDLVAADTLGEADWVKCEDGGDHAVAAFLGP